MKHLPLLLFLFVFSSGKTQTYEPIFELGKIWVSACNGADCAEEIAYISKDTILEGKTYYEVLKSCPTEGLVGYFRTDDRNSKVWFMQDIDIFEYLIMDLDLELGEQFTIGPSQEEVIEVVAVDTIDDRKVIRFALEIESGTTSIPEGIPFTFIEGVGTSAGLSYWVNNSGNGFFDYILHCVLLDENPVYTETAFSWDCNTNCSVSTPRYSDSEKVTIFPNPAKESITIDIDGAVGNDIFEVSIFSIAGRKERFIPNYQSRDLIDLNSLARGVYLVEIRGLQNERTILKKIVTF